MSNVWSTLTYFFHYFEPGQKYIRVTVRAEIKNIKNNTITVIKTSFVQKITKDVITNYFLTPWRLGANREKHL